MISVVVPIFNVGIWIERCLNKILSQSFSNIEVILVNDGSEDNSQKICEEFVKKDNRVRLINKDNGGLSSARNTGIGIATGKYIVFIDPDDEIVDGYFNSLYETAEKYNCDSVISGYRTIPTNKNQIPNYKLNEVLTGEELILSSLNIHSNNDLCFVWRYIYKMDVIRNKKIKFNEQVFIGEDVIFNLEFLLNSKRVIAIKDIYYLYTVNNPESLMRVTFKPKLEESLIKQYEIRKCLSQQYGLSNDKNYTKDLANYYINVIYKLILKNLLNSNNNDVNKELKRVLNYKMFRESVREIGLFYKCNNFREYIYYLAFKFKIYSLIMLNINHESR